MNTTRLNLLNIEALSDEELREIVDRATNELRTRRIRILKAEPCNCDRYTCLRCYELQQIGS